MAITSTTFTAVKTLFVAKLSEVTGLNVFSVGDTTPALPSVEVLWPRFRRVGVDEAEDQLGSVSLTTYWPLRLSVDADSLAQSQVDAFSYLGQIIGKFDANESLGTTAADGFAVLCRVTDGDEDRAPIAGDSKATRSYVMTFEIRQKL